MSAVSVARRIVVMGPPGSGKSTVARRIGATLALPVVHIDQLQHAPGWTPRPAAAFDADLAKAVAMRAWVIDGNYLSHGAERFSRADLILLLDLPPRLTFWRILKRTLANYGKVRVDSAPGCPERLSLRFFLYCCLWNATKRSAWLKAVAAYRDRVAHLRSDADVERLVARLQPSS